MSLIIGIGTRIGRRVNKALKKWHTVVSQLQAMFLYRVAGGADNDDLPEKNGRAVINAIYGNTVKWNQLVDDPSLINKTKWSNTNSNIESIEGGGFRITKTSNQSGGTLYKRDIIPPVGHKCMTVVDIAEINITGSSQYVCFGFSDNRYFTTKGLYVNTVGRHGVVYIINEEHESFGVRVGMGGTDIGSNATIKSINLFDLTEMGIDDIINSYDDFEAWLALNVGTQDYYPYDEGSLISFKGTGVKSVGFNQWDKTGEEGKYLLSDGRIDTASTYTLSNYIHVLPNTNYYFKKIVSSGAVSASICWYDAGKTFISSNVGNAGINNKVIQSPSNACYLRLSIYTININYAIVNLSDAAKNGTYEPYWSDEKPFDVTKVYGTPGGSSILEQVYPDGMFGALDEAFGGDALGYYYGSLLAWVAVRKIDLGNCIWSLVSGCSHTFETNIDIDAAEAIDYTYSETIDETDTTQDKLIGPTNGFHLTILDRSLSSTDLVDGHIAALEGVYVLITPYTGAVGYDSLVYRDNGVDTPLEQLFPFKYNVDKYSTEEVLVPTGDAPTSTSMIADIEYQAR